MLNYVGQVFKLRVVFHTLTCISEMTIVTPFFCVTDKSNSLSDCSKNFKKIDRVQVLFMGKALQPGLSIRVLPEGKPAFCLLFKSAGNLLKTLYY